MLGYLDDLVVTPIGIALALKMISAEIMSDARQQAEALIQQSKPASRVGAFLVIAIWLAVAMAIIWSLGRAIIN